jgi:hypothetical protein
MDLSAEFFALSLFDQIIQRIERRAREQRMPHDRPKSARRPFSLIGACRPFHFSRLLPYMLH